MTHGERETTEAGAETKAGRSERGTCTCTDSLLSLRSVCASSFISELRAAHTTVLLTGLWRAARVCPQTENTEAEGCSEKSRRNLITRVCRRTFAAMTEKAVCAGCQRAITDRFMLRVTEGLWHERCVRCSACGDALSHSCFLRDRKLYCRKDYALLFAVRCAGCSEPLSPSELVMHAGSSVFHMRCFTCSVCSCRLQTGDRCVLRAGQLLCARDQYHQGLVSPTSSDTSKSDEEEDEEGESERSRSNRSEDLDSKRPKRPRTILTTQQRRTFKASFEVSSKPCRKVRETLAAETGLSVRVVQVWFQNQRAKMKKLARRQQQQQQEQQQQSQEHEQTKQHTAPSRGGLGEMEQLASSCSHVQQQQQMGLTSLEQPDFDMDPFRQGLTPPQMPGDHMHPYGFKGMYDVDSDPLCHMTDSDCLHLADSSLLTPIDRLYSMQDSYFTS